MARYGRNYYGSTKYGTLAKSAYSVEPMLVLVLDFSRIYLEWLPPRGSFSRVRLVRSQAGLPETAEDGIIIFDEVASEGTVSRSYLIDGEDNPFNTPFIPGRECYYRFFIFTNEKIWKVAGSIAVVPPSNHDSQNKFINTLPRVFTTSEQSPLGAVDPGSTIYKFIDGVMFTQEEFLTMVDQLLPKVTTATTPLALIPLKSNTYGLTPEPALPTKNQKRLIREALYMYNRKGTKLTLDTYVESLTGFAPTITVSENLLLTVEDSTFKGGIGNWISTNGVLTESTEQVAATGPKVIDHDHSGKIIAAGSGNIILGGSNVVTKGVPILPSTEYTVSCKLKSPGSAGNIIISVKFYDFAGIATSSYHNSSSVSANNTWKSASVTTTSDAESTYAVIKISYSASGTYYIDQVCMQLGDTVSYDEARAIDIFLAPINKNSIKNPSFEVNATDNWTTTGSPSVSTSADVSTFAYSGSNSGKIIASNPWTITSNAVPVQLNHYYTVSALFKSTSNLTCTLIGRNLGGEIVDNTDVSVFGTSASWAYGNSTVVTGYGHEDIATYEVMFSGNSGTFYLDCVQFEANHTPSDYFDGSLPSSFGAVWEGTANNSYSHLYPTKPQKIQRLSQTLVDWVPMNAFWRLSTYYGVEATNLTV